MSTSDSPVFRLAPAAQNYSWGKIGKDSLAARLAAQSGLRGFKIERSTPYAELWMGTHPNAPARVLTSGQLLSEFLVEHPQLIGNAVLNKFNITDGQLPFLFKVLSFRKALPTQIHPDKTTAERLHAEQPDVYTDPNHKPEIAIALSHFRAMCGFLPSSQIAVYLRSTPEFADLMPAVIVDQFLFVTASNPSESDEKAALRDLLSAFLTADVLRVKEKLRALVNRYETGTAKDEEKDIQSLVLDLYEQYPGDNGVFAAFLLNYVELEPGQALFLAAAQPHAYVTGDIIECMANSDNVIEAGLTSGTKDISNYVSGVSYTPAPAETRMLKPQPFAAEQWHASDSPSTLYDPPIDELSVVQIILRAGQTEVHSALGGPSIVLVLEGHGVMERVEDGKADAVSAGHVWFVGQGVAIKFKAGSQEMRIYRAFVEA